MWQTVNPASVYRRGRYVPTAAASHPIPMPDFLRRVSADRRSQQPRPEVSRPPRYAPTTNQQAVRVCPQCREVPLGPGPVVNGQPTYPVCEECRQTNIRQQVLRGIAAEALVELSRRAVVHSPGRADREEAGRRRDLSEPRPVPKATQGFLCLRCKRPGVPLAPGRRRCVECICVLVAFGPDKGRQTVEDEPEHGGWHTCNGCFRNQVPPGEGKCHDCVDRFASQAQASTTLAAAAATCVICESESAANGQAYCNNCEVEGSRGMGASVMLDTKQCTACGEEVDSTADGLCWDCRMPPRSPDERDDEEWLENEIETWEDGPSQQHQQQQQAQAQAQQSGRDKMCGCLRNAARWGRMLCNDCYEALRSVDRRGWADWKRRNWPSKARRVARRREEQSSWR
ncbi:hypothetical protein QIS74_01481 [Colletotrichum tabaci]|uniref:Uncharacterized protein n=1 Tax=Colletotrichum tabaci TaxID=1209068 RepID=A0AAV9TTL2_9PEZI